MFYTCYILELFPTSVVSIFYTCCILEVLPTPVTYNYFLHLPNLRTISYTCHILELFPTPYIKIILELLTTPVI